MAEFKVLLVDRIDQRAIDLLGEMAEVMIAKSSDEAALLDLVGDVDGIVIRANGAITRRIMEGAPRLKVVGRHGVGMDNVDVAAATELGIWAVFTPQANLESVAEHAIGMLVVLSKQIVKADRALRRGYWQGRFEFHGNEVMGKTLGIVGVGRIGGRLAEIARVGFSMDLLYYDVVANPFVEKLGARRCELDELLTHSDYVSIHVPLMPSTEHLIGKRELALMKPTAYLLNLARGKVVDEPALIEALQAGRIAGAGLDVFEAEPPAADNPLWQMDNVVVTPHMAAHTQEGLFNMAMVVKDIMAVLQGQPPQFPFNRPKSPRAAG